MSNHDFRCPQCGTVLHDHWVPTGQRATDHAPVCCTEAMEWIPGTTAMDAGSGPGWTTFSAYDGRNNPVVIDSLAKLRAVERESEVLARNGEGQQIVWRHYAQSSTNREVNTLGTSPAQQPKPESIAKFGPTIHRSETDPDLAFGPAVSDENCSALQGGVDLPPGE